MRNHAQARMPLQRIVYHGHGTLGEIVQKFHASPVCRTSEQKSPLSERKENEIIK